MWIWWLAFPLQQKSAVGILIWIALNLWVALGRTISSVLIHECRISLHFFTRFSPLWQFTPSYFILLHDIIGGTAFSFSFSDCSLLVHRNTTDFNVLILHPVVLMHLFIALVTFLCILWEKKQINKHLSQFLQIGSVLEHSFDFFLIFKNIYLFIYFGCTRSQLLHTGSSLPHVGSSLWHEGALVAACKLLVVACMWDLVSWSEIEPGSPALGA